MNSSMLFLKEGLASIMSVGVVGVPMTSVLFAKPISMPPKQFESEQ